MSVSPTSSSRSSRAPSVAGSSPASTHVSTVASTVRVLPEPSFAPLIGKQWQTMRNVVIGVGILAAITATALFAISHSEYCLITTGGLLTLAGTLTLLLNDQKKKHWKKVGWSLIGLGIVAGICALWVQIMFPANIQPSLEKVGYVLAGVGLLSPFVALVAHKQKKWWAEGWKEEALALHEMNKSLEVPSPENQIVAQTFAIHEVKLRAKVFKFSVIPAAILIILGIGFQLMVNKAGWNFTDIQAKSLQDMACNLWVAAIPLAIIGAVSLYLKKWWEKHGEEHYLNLLDPARTVTAPGLQIKTTKDMTLKVALHVELFSHLTTITNGMKSGETKHMEYSVKDNRTFNTLKGEKQALEATLQERTVTIKNGSKSETVNLDELYQGKCVQTTLDALKAILAGSDEA